MFSPAPKLLLRQNDNSHSIKWLPWWERHLPPKIRTVAFESKGSHRDLFNIHRPVPWGGGREKASITQWSCKDQTSSRLFSFYSRIPDLKEMASSGHLVWAWAGQDRSSLEAWWDLVQLRIQHPSEIGSLSSWGEGITRALGFGARSAESALIYELRLSSRRHWWGWLTRGAGGR